MAEPELDGLGKLLQEVLDKDPTLADKLAVDTSNQLSAFDTEYTFENPSIYESVKDEISAETSQLFIVYNRLLRAYAGNNDTQFVIDFFAHGGAAYPTFINNKGKMLNSLLLRGSQIRLLIADRDQLTTDNFLDVYDKALESWALCDALEAVYGSFLPLPIARMMAEVQIKAVQSDT